MPEPSSLRDLLRRSSPSQIEEAIAGLSEADAEELLYDWDGLWARPNQLAPPGEWRQWMLQAGRGFGKTKSAAQWSKSNLVEMPGCRGVIAARTIEDARDICVEGESGLLSCFPPSWITSGRVTWNRSLGEGFLHHPDGPPSQWKCRTSEKPDSFRGWQSHWLWADELAAWLKGLAAWEQVPYVVRLKWPDAPERAGRVIISTTPRPLKAIRELHKDPLTVVTRGSTSENWANLNALTRAKLERLKGTRMGRQELEAELLDDVPGALWTRALLESRRVAKVAREALSRIVVAVDPAVTAQEDSDETGIIVEGQGDAGRYVLADGSMRGKPVEWATRVLDLYEEWEADEIVVEVNQGGDMVANTIRQLPRGKHVSITEVRASRGKRTRAEPVATAFEAGEVKLAGAFETLEDQLCTWTVDSGESPDRLDALVWADTALQGGEVGEDDVAPRVRRPTRRTGLAGMQT